MSTVLQTRVAVVGAGNTGSSFAYSLLLSGLSPQILFVDPDLRKAEEQALDLQQASVFSVPHEVRAATMAELSNASIIAICGAQHQPGVRGDELAERNLNLIRQTTLHVSGKNPAAIILVGADPVDLLTYAAWKFSGLARQQVIGTGTVAETATLRYLLGRHFRLDPRSVHAYVLGGDAGKFPVWSSATIAGMYITEVCKAHGCPPAVLNSIFNEVRDRTANLEAHPEAAWLSTGSGLARIAGAILRNENHVFSVSTVLQNEYGLADTALGVPAVIGEKGIDRILRVELNDDEVARLLACGEKTRRSIRNLELDQPRRALGEAS